VFAILLLVVAIGFLASRSSRSQYGAIGILPANNLNVKIQAEAIKNIVEKDSDSDGLKDWEEALWESDPRKSDTDGDGTPDGDEVNAGRNPLIAGPDDKYKSDTVIRKINKNISGEAPTKTEEFAQSFFQDYITLRNSNNLFEEYEKNNLINDYVDSVIKTNTLIKDYTVADLNISQNINKASSIDYGNTLGGIILKHSFETENELTIFNNSIIKEDIEEIEKLNPIINAYKNILKDSLEMLVPQDAINEHITFVIGIASIVESIESMYAIYNDPIKAIVGISNYEQSVFLLKDAFRNMRNYFMTKGVLFKENDNGYVMTNII